MNHLPPMCIYPAISIVIPMYNAEKYIGACLASLLAQTFQDFEVIVVDDCSTDNSAAIVESYVEKFGGRLTLTSMKKNSGGGGAPRNKGLSFSRGEYIFFSDADDLFTKTALEEMQTLTKNFDADVIYFERHYEAKEDLSEIRIRGRHSGGFVDKPTFEADDLIERLRALLLGRFGVTPWIKLSRRSVLLENEIFFPHIIGEDEVWTVGLIFFARKILRVPNAIYVYRKSENSVMRKERTPQENITFRLSSLVFGLKALDKMISNQKFFQQNPQYHYDALSWFVNTRYEYAPFFEESIKLEPFEIYAAIKQEFGDKLGEFDILIPALCTALNTRQKIFAANVQRFNEYAAQAQKRIAELEGESKRKD